MHHLLKKLGDRLKAFALKGTGPLLLILVLTSCIPDPLELKDIPDVEPEIVVATQMVSNRSVLVLLTRTFNALELRDDVDEEEFLRQIAINDAVVTISGPGGTDTLRFRENGLYAGFRLSLRPGETYELRVESETMGTVFATTTVQPRVELKEVEADLYYEGLNDTLVAITYEFRDPAEKNWYMLNIQKLEQEKLLANAINPEAFTVLFDDAEFNGEYFKEAYNFFPDEYVPGDTVVVSLSNISQEYYQFMELRMAERLSFLEFLSEPFNYPANVQGGKGFFNLYFPETRLLVLERQR